MLETEDPELREPDEKLERPAVAPENLGDPDSENLEEPSPDDLVKPVDPENLDDGTETDLEEDPIPMEEMACWMAGVSCWSTCPTTFNNQINFMMGPLSSFNLSLVDLRCRIGSSRHQSEEELRRGHPASGDQALQLTPDNPSTALYTTECSPRSNADLALRLHSAFFELQCTAVERCAVSISSVRRVVLTNVVTLADPSRIYNC